MSYISILFARAFLVRVIRSLYSRCNNAVVPPLFISASSEPGLRHVSVGDGKITLLIFTFSKQAFNDSSD